MYYSRISVNFFSQTKNVFIIITIKSVDNIKKVCDYAAHHSPDTKILISLLTMRKDNDNLNKLLLQMNQRLKKFASKNNLVFIDNANVDDSCLGKGKLHLNNKGKSIPASNI